ncbi:glycosyltransferase [Mycolicibacterium sp. BiH015]|uniref:glycosyltransferase n=1 Tax=Mycolicibacterium sp. BiH015 TaxID=3018808 RepID=UPI0022E47A67|nr:glycosyltransferase [Mycolicibacterium sp. BiH015]MDA2890733.1 glycosyltransferase [Mycolicibacterium sp. BiH015]
MRFALANWGTRGEIEPFVALGRELVRNGHDVRIAAAPEMVSFAGAAGIEAVGYGPELATILDPHRDYWTCFYSAPWRVRTLRRLLREVSEPLSEFRGQVSATLMALSDGADVLITGMNFEDVAANVAEYRDIPLATLFHFPMRANGQLVRYMPTSWARATMTFFEWMSWRGKRKAEDDAQRLELGLHKATTPWPQRIADRGSLEIQAYDEACFPGLAAEWAHWNRQIPPKRPFVGALTMALPTDADDDVTSWIDEGTPPICFGFGSVGVESAGDTLAMISAVCAELGERALVCAAGSDFSGVPQSDDVKIVGQVNYATIFPRCKAVVHHGGSGTTNAVLRAGVPGLILWTLPDQSLWAARLKRLKVGAGRRFSATTQKTLAADLRAILAPDFVARAGELATRMTSPADSVAVTVGLAENYARDAKVG